MTSISHKDIALLSQKSSVDGTEKLPVSSTEYITPSQIKAVPVASTQPSGGLLPNVKYNLGTLSGSVTIDFASPASNSVVNEYNFTFDTDSTLPTISWPSGLTWKGECVSSSTNLPVLAESKHYEVSSEDGYAFIAEF